MGILHNAVTNPEEEYKQVLDKLEFFNVASPGRDRLIKRKFELDNERLHRLRHPAGCETVDKSKFD